SAFMFQGLLTTYSVAYGVQIGVEQQTILNALSFSSFFAIFGIILWSRLSDVVGRRPLVIAGAVFIAVWGFALFSLIAPRSAVVLASPDPSSARRQSAHSPYSPPGPLPSRLPGAAGSLTTGCVGPSPSTRSIVMFRPDFNAMRGKRANPQTAMNTAPASS